VQLADSLIRYPEGIVGDSFILANFVVMDIEGNLIIQLILGLPFLRAVRARIDVRKG